LGDVTVTDDEIADYRPRIVMVGEGNTVKSVGDAEHAGVRVA